MVNKYYISKAFDEIISKHSDFLYNIEGTLREITDSKEEYRTLKEDIWRFYKETKKSDHEQVIIKATDGTFFENHGGNDTHVGVPDGVSDYAKQGELLYSIHNHPNQSDYPSSCFQSKNDVLMVINNGIKYGVTVSSDGVMILKNNNEHSITSKETMDFFLNASESCRKNDEHISERFKEEYKSKIDELKKKYNIGDFSRFVDVQEYRKAEAPLYQEFLTNNFDEIMEDLEDNFKKNNVPIDVVHVPKKPRLY